MVKGSIKQKVVNRLLGICECGNLSSLSGRPCRNISPYNGFNCSRDRLHEGNHFACGSNHKIEIWRRDGKLLSTKYPIEVKSDGRSN